jgi:predicted nucleic acid-binding protein
VSSGRLAFDSSPLNYIARANQLPFLEKLVADNDCVITRAVEDELLCGAPKHAQLYQVSAQQWIRVVDDSSIAFLQLFSEYHTRLGGGDRNVGESATLAYAELHGLTACIDDRAARRHGQERGVPLTGTLELVCRGIRANVVEEAEAARVIDLLRDHEAFLPCDGSTFVDWARAEGLLS